MLRNPVVLILLVLLGSVLGGVVWLGAFPPAPQTVPVERVLPNDRFGVR